MAASKKMLVFAPICVRECSYYWSFLTFVRPKVHRYLFLKHVESKGLLTCGVILFTRYYGTGKTQLLWKENPTNLENLTLKNNMIKLIDKDLPKYFPVRTKQKPESSQRW